MDKDVATEIASKHLADMVESQVLVCCAITWIHPNKLRTGNTADCCSCGYDTVHEGCNCSWDKQSPNHIISENRINVHLSLVPVYAGHAKQSYLINIDTLSIPFVSWGEARHKYVELIKNMNLSTYIGFRPINILTFPNQQTCWYCQNSGALQLHIKCAQLKNGYCNSKYNGPLYHWLG